MFQEGKHFYWQKRWCWYWMNREAVLLNDYSYENITVPKKFHWNGPSVGIASSKTMRGSCLHDFIYRTKPDGISRKEADEILIQVFREDGATFLAWCAETWIAKALFWIAWRTPLG